MLSRVEPPNERIAIICSILKFLFFITLCQAIFELASQGPSKFALYLFSAILYPISWRPLDYYPCIINSIINLILVLMLLLEVCILLLSWRIEYPTDYIFCI